MEALILRGVPMRSAHEVVGKLVRQCEQQRCRLADLKPEIYDAIHSGLGQEVYGVLGVKNALAAFRSLGSTAPAEVEKQLSFWKDQLILN
jgi:argininosuccinate lyase